MIEIFNSGIANYFQYIALLAMLGITMEFYFSGAWEYDRILLCSNIIVVACITLFVFGNGDIAVVFVVFAYILLNIYSQFFRRR